MKKLTISFARFFFEWALLVSIAIGTVSQMHGQFLGHNAKGDFGLMSGSQLGPGFYFAPMYYRYDADRLRDRFGNTSQSNLSGSLDVNAYLAGAWYVSDFKILGANYGFLIFPGFTDNAFEVPILNLERRSSTGLADLYFQPLNLGWKTERADFSAGLGVFAPTGRYDPEASDNLGLGMWSFEPYFGTTLFFDEAKSWHFAATAFYETHTKKKDTDLKVGDILTLEGGMGKSFKQGALTVGAAYFAQWKITQDDIGLNIPLPEGREIGKHRSYGLGPEVAIPIATKTKLIAMLNVRYLWEFGARTTLEGRILVITATFPIPSVKLP
jgi:hypothetical protein